MPSDAEERTPEAVDVTVDGRLVSVPAGTTLLRTAEIAGITIPSLCAHRELSPFGGCRLCAVEISGVPGRPLACSTPAQQGMEVVTDGDDLREMRRELLRLILASHPSSCLFCDEREACTRSQATIRKVGVTTSCSTCPRDGDCELQQVVEQVGVGELEYSASYRGLPAEHDDPFYDRDYNLCILCGRCVRVCREVRGASVLAFNYRSRHTVIGPAFGRSHVDAGCEFCGACVSVCPTGALVDKVSKWDGRPDGMETSTCPFCSLGCRVELLNKGVSLSQVRGAQDAELNDGQLCVRGRFCLPEATHHPSRVRAPMLRRGPYLRVVDWDLALAVVAEQLADCPPGELLMLVSPDLTNEGVYAAQHFVRESLSSNGLDSTARVALPGGPVSWSRLFALPISLQAVAEADVVVSAGLPTRFSFSVAGVQIRRAMRRGARLVVVDARESSLARVADQWITASPGTEAAALVQVLSPSAGREPGGAGRRSGVMGSQARALRTAEELVAGAARLAVVVGPRVFHSTGATKLVAVLEAAATRAGITILPLTHGANVRGMLELGGLHEVGPGPRSLDAPGLTLQDVLDGRRPKVLYLVGEAPFAKRPDCDYLIAQDLVLPPFPVDAFLPAASFAEAEGTLTNIEGRVQDVRAVERRHEDAVNGYARPDWRIFAGLARELETRPLEGERLGSRELDVASAAGVRAAIRREVPDFPTEGDRRPRRMPPSGWSQAAVQSRAAGGEAGSDGAGRFVLVPDPPGFRHRGFDLADVVEGLGELRLEEGLRMNPDDLARLRVETGGCVTVVLEGRDLSLTARPDAACPRGAAYLSRMPAWRGPTWPVRVRISAGDRARRSRLSPLTSAVRTGR